MKEETKYKIGRILIYISLIAFVIASSSPFDNKPTWCITSYNMSSNGSDNMKMYVSIDCDELERLNDADEQQGEQDE